MEVNEIIRNRKSTVSFSEKPVGAEVLESLFKAARLAPSSYNEQPWRFIYAKKGSQSYKKIYQSLVPGNQVWAKNAPVLVVTILSKYLERNGKPNKYAWYDLGQAVGNISAQATSVGLKMHQMGGFDSGKLVELFNIGNGYQPASVIAIGYPGNIDSLNEKLKQREKGVRSRKDLSEIVFEEVWHEVSDLS